MNPLAEKSKPAKAGCDKLKMCLLRIHPLHTMPVLGDRDVNFAGVSARSSSVTVSEPMKTVSSGSFQQSPPSG
jgi:hypothetical protein